MSTFKYDTGAYLIGTAGIDLLTAVIKAAVVSSGYAASKAKDQYVSDIPSAAILTRSSQLASPAIVRGVFSAIIPEALAFTATVDAIGIILFRDTGNDSTSALLYYSDDGIGFPFLPAGLNYFFAFDQANGGWFEV